MTTVSQPTAPPLSRSEYERLAAKGAFHPDARVELLAGQIHAKMPQSSLHALAVRRCQEVLRQIFGDGYDVRPQLPLALSEDSEPEPDIAVVEGRYQDYRDHHPRSAVLLVEIADTSLGHDRGTKKDLYAAAGIPEYWLLNLTAHRLEVYREPDGVSYRSTRLLGPEDTISSLARPQAVVRVSDLLP